MKRSQLIGALCALSLTVGLTASGCQPAKLDKLTVGKVDTAVLLQDDPEYQSLSIDYMKENTDLRKKFVDQMRAASGDTAKGDVQAAYKGAQQKLDGKWMDKTQKFLESRHAYIRDSAKQIAEKKDIDMVIIDSRVYPTTEWGGVDITPDLQLSMTQGDVKPAASGTPSPAKKGG